MSDSEQEGSFTSEHEPLPTSWPPVLNMPTPPDQIMVMTRRKIILRVYLVPSASKEWRVECTNLDQLDKIEHVGDADVDMGEPSSERARQLLTELKLDHLTINFNLPWTDCFVVCGFKDGVRKLAEDQEVPEDETWVPDISEALADLLKSLHVLVFPVEELDCLVRRVWQGEDHILYPGKQWERLFSEFYAFEHPSSPEKYVVMSLDAIEEDGDRQTTLEIYPERDSRVQPHVSTVNTFFQRYSKKVREARERDLKIPRMRFGGLRETQTPNRG